MADLIMPKMSDAMEEGKILRWLKNPGDMVEKGEPIAEIETDKANVELEAPDSGVLAEIKAHEGETIPIGTLIAVIAPAGELAGMKGGATAEAPPQKEQPPVAQEEARTVPPPEEKIIEYPAQEEPPPPMMEETIEYGSIISEAEGLRASPLARKIARDAGVNLDDVHGTGPGGRIVEADVRDFIEQRRPARLQAPERKPEAPVPTERPAQPPKAPPTPPPPPTLAARRLEVGNIWKTVARRMTESKQQVPHFYVSMQVDMDEAIMVRKWLNDARREDRQISLNDMIIKACALALVKHPTLNASYQEDGIIQMHDTINIGVAVAIPDGLIAPVVRDCQMKSLTAISDDTRELIHKTRQGTIQPEEYTGATFTISNLGMYGVEEFSAIIAPQQSSILAVGAAMPVPVAVEDQVVIKNLMKITVSGDHRVTDGARVAEFMRDLKQILEQPMLLVE